MKTIRLIKTTKNPKKLIKTVSKITIILVLLFISCDLFSQDLNDLTTELERAKVTVKSFIKVLLWFLAVVAFIYVLIAFKTGQGNAPKNSLIAFIIILLAAVIFSTLF